jgi:hypothetical protein
VIFASGHFAASAMAMQPVPVPKSKAVAAVEFGLTALREIASRVRRAISVSGRGTSAWRFTAISNGRKTK